MKCKEDFVTNSSSASFIFGYKSKPESMKVKVECEVDLEKDIQHTFRTVEDIDDYYIKEYGYDSIADLEEYDKEEYSKMKALIEEGGIVYIMWVSSEDDDNPLTGFMYSGIKPNIISADEGEELIILRDMDGY